MANKKNVKGLDLGTSHIVMARHGEEGYEFTQELNAFVEIPFSRITINMLERHSAPPGWRRLLCLRQRGRAVRQHDRRQHTAADV